MSNEIEPDSQPCGMTRRGFLTVASAGTATLWLKPGLAAAPLLAPTRGTSGKQGAKISIRVLVGLWSNPQRRNELRAFIQDYRDVIDEVAFFTSLTHPPLPLAVVQSRAALLAQVVPQFKDLGVTTGINHLATLGHLDENLENSLREPWQHLVDFDGAVSASCYCAADPRVQEYIRRCYMALARAKPDFIWVDDDVRMESHGPIRFACFCDRCLAAFSREAGREWTRVGLVAGLRSGPRSQRLALRRQWLAHNRAYLKDLLVKIREAVDSVDPSIPLGLMTGEISYSGYGFGDWATALAGRNPRPVKWRPGGGFYNDDVPLQLLDKAHSTGRQIALLPPSLTDIQYEHENFPYQRLKKSVTTFTAEIAAAIGAGCTGAALNCLGIVGDPPDEYRPYFDGVRACRAFFDKAVAAFGRSPCEGLWSAFTRDHFAVLQADGDWFASPAWGGDLRSFNEMAELGIPAAYGREGARIAVLSGESCLDFSQDDLLKLLAGGVLLDVPALARLHELGLAEHAGFAVRGRKEKDTLEQFSSDPLNGPYAGRQRDCRPSFYPEPAWLIEPLVPQARPLSEIIDFTPKGFGAASGVFENRLGGRVAVFGYYPWRSLQSLAKASQLKSVLRWLSRDKLPAYVSSYAKAAIWCRRDPVGRPAILLLSASADWLASVSLHVRDTDNLTATRGGGQSDVVQKTGADGPYAIFRIRNVKPWEPVLLTTE